MDSAIGLVGRPDFTQMWILSSQKFALNMPMMVEACAVLVSAFGGSVLKMVRVFSMLLFCGLACLSLNRSLRAWAVVGRLRKVRNLPAAFAALDREMLEYGFSGLVCFAT